MRTKEEYYDHVLENRRVVADPENLRCTCTQTLCEWHGRCRECVALHRHYKDHVPACLPDYIADRLKAVARIGVLTVKEDEPTPIEHRLYVRERDREESES
jgi:hypothetical protein